MLDFNKQMLPWQIGIQAAGTLSHVLSSAVSIYNAIDSYSKQKEIKLGEDFRSAMENQKAYEIYHGIKPEITFDEKTGKYSALTPESQKIKNDFLQRVKDEMSGPKWGNAGRAEEMISQIYSDINTASAKMLGVEAERLLTQQFAINRKDGIQNAIAGDLTLYNQTMKQAKDWMPDHVLEQMTAEDMRTIRSGQVENAAMQIGGANGMDAVGAFLKEQDLTKAQSAAIFSQAQQASNQAVTAATTAATETYNTKLSNGGTIGDSYRAAIANPSSNPAVAEAAKKAAQTVQFESLSNRFGQDLAGSDAMSVEELKQLRKVYENRRSDYQDQGTLYDQHMARFDREIAQSQTRSGGGSSASTRIEAENVMANLFVQFNNKELSGPSAIRGIDQLRELSPLKAAEYEAKILGGGDNPAAKETYLALDAIIQANKPKSNAPADEKINYDKNAQDVRQAIFQAYFDGIRGEDLAQLVEGYRKEMASKVLQEAFQKGTIGSTGAFGSADKTATAFAYHSNQGNLDLRYSERTTDARRPEDTTTLTIGGEKAEQVMQQAAEKNRDWANYQLYKKGLQLTGINYEKDAGGDRNGRVSYSASDGNTYRINAESENGSRFLERFENGRWVRVNFRDIPYTAPPRGTLNKY